jgi:hypothetical protein
VRGTRREGRLLLLGLVGGVLGVEMERLGGGGTGFLGRLVEVLEEGQAASGVFSGRVFFLCFIRVGFRR